MNYRDVREMMREALEGHVIDRVDVDCESYNDNATEITIQVANGGYLVLQPQGGGENGDLRIECTHVRDVFLFPADP